MIEREVPVDSIRTGRRSRALGDIDALAKSIDDIGLIFPVVLGPGDELVLGPRRLAAVKSLGRETVQAIEVSNLDEVTERIRIEALDDTEAKPLTPSELVSLGRVLEWIHEPARHKRRLEVARGARAARAKGPGKKGRIYPNSSERIANALGMAITTYSRAKHVVMALDHADPAIRKVAREQAAAMDHGGSISRAYDKVRTLTAETELPPGVTGGTSPLVGAGAQRRAFQAALLALDVVGDGLGRMAAVDERISPDEAAQWVDGLADSRRIIARTINRLRQHIAKGQVT